MSSDNNVKREYQMDFDIVEAANAEDEFSFFASLPDMQPSTSAGLSSSTSAALQSTVTGGFSYGHLIGQMVLDTVEGFLLVVNESAIIDFASQNVAAYTDYTAEDLVHRPLYTILHNEDRQLVQPLIASVAGTAPVNPHSSRAVLRLLPNWRPGGAPRAGSAACQPLALEATLKVQSLSDSQSSSPGLSRRYLVCLMKPSPPQQRQQQQQQMSLPIQSSQPPPTTTRASLSISGSRSQPQPPPQPHSLSDYISCQHSCSGSNEVLQAVCSSALASKLSVRSDFFIGRRWCNLVLPADRTIWQRHVEDVVSSRDALSSGIYRCLVTAAGQMAFVKSRSYLTDQQSGQFTSTHCIIRFCDSEADLSGAPSASLLRRVGSGSGSSPPAASLQQQPQPRPSLGPRERQELLSLGALYKSCAKQDPDRAEALRNRMLALWSDSQQQQQQQQPPQTQPQTPAPALFLSALPRTTDTSSSLSTLTTSGQQPASLLMKLLNGPSQHSCAVSLTSNTLQELLCAKETQARMAEQQQVSSTTATPSTPGRKRQPSWPEELGGGGDVDSSTQQLGGGKRKPPGGTQLLAALLSDSAAAAATTSAASSAAANRGPAAPAAIAAGGGDNGNGGEETGVLDSILKSIDDLKQQQQQQQLLQQQPAVTIALIQQPPPPLPPPTPPQHPQPVDIAGSAELPEDVVLDIILDMEERHRQPAPDSTTPGSAGSGSGGVGASPSAPAAPPSNSGGGLLEKLLSS
ncbi:hypothetical protein BOX15_Mlig006527g2 [Macrostomum lignano]|uniref:PAS domain-containing protein n=3 Tax=Macrostomum lignano TaxID=282301 RepID=A0A267FU73_9PLAT|nr:hypothetical protein BOX15_Mlig006527g2 [Macrostomum lignano]